MHRMWLLLSLACCGGSAPAPEAPEAPRPAEASCGSAADNMVAMLAAGMEPQPPDDQLDALSNLIREHCEQDAWPVEARRCLRTTKTASDADECGTLLTEAQQRALVDALPAPKTEPSSSAPPSPPPAPDPEPVMAPETRQREPKPKPASPRQPTKTRDDLGADPCDGGE